MKEFRLVAEARQVAAEKAELTSLKGDISSVILGLLAQFDHDKPAAISNYSEEFCGYPSDEFYVHCSRTGQQRDGGFDMCAGLTHGEFTRTLIVTDEFTKVVDAECILNREGLPPDIEQARNASAEDLKGFKELVGAMRLNPGID